jgi:hypothetical protein
MLGFVTRFGSSKGMVAVPNLSGRTFDQALSDIQAAGLKFKNGTIRITNNQALDKKVFAQAQTAGELIDYESEISFNYDSYYIGAGGVSYGPIERNLEIQPVLTLPCDGTTLVRTTTYANRREVRFNNVFQFYEAAANSSESSREPNSAFCGYVVPPRVCPTSDVATSSWSACRQTPRTYTGTRTRSRLAIRSDCSQVPYTQTGNCCIPHIGTWTGWVGYSPIGGSRSRTDVLDADCNTNTIYERVCTDRCPNPWINVGTCRSGRQTQTTTCVRTLRNPSTGLQFCSNYSKTRTVSCAEARYSNFV